MTVSMRPLGDRILVKPVKHDSKSPIITPDTVDVGENQLYQVVKLGTGREKGPKCAKCGHKTPWPFDVQVGNIVAIRRFSGIQLRLDGEDYRLMNSEEIIAAYE